ncbi:MAG: peptidoglycan DD-metalloendopeptidase family protein [Oscillospiraceae bacterium]|jgi:murein DD-endopeptidase MepM/ murein hydrolase activator NlpD|nr:peptidoglycan DD-metalloendopeptidase family protein [Oscillospiraceae bacterium]
MRQSDTKMLAFPREMICAGSIFAAPQRRRRRDAAMYAAAVTAAVIAAAALVAPRAALAGNVKVQETTSISVKNEVRAPSRVRVEEASNYLTVPFETVTVSSPEMYEGDTVVVTGGRDGLRRVITLREYYEGEDDPKETVSSELIIAPVAEQIAVGTAERPPTASYGSYIRPAAGEISSFFGFRRDAIGSSDHKGIDIAGGKGDAIYAADGGEVILADDSIKGFGLLVQIKHDNGDVTYYGHNSKLLVSEGERVSRGQKIAEMGATGVASGVHCHFEIRKDGVPVNPIKYLP